MSFFFHSTEYPKERHAEHSDFPLAPERMVVQPEELSSTHKEMLSFLYGESYKPMPSTEKLIPNLKDKNFYILHYRNLKLYLSLGMRLKKVHRCLRFTQTPWLKPYIDFNTDKRSRAQNEFEKDFFKLMNNAMFGKTMENMRNRRDINLVTNEESLRKFAAQPSFKRCTIFHESLVAVERIKTTVKLNRPIYTGVAVLDLAKHAMYEFHYTYVKKEYPGEKSKLLFTDTDSLLYRIQCDDLYADMYKEKNRDRFDFSDYPKDHLCFSAKNKKKIGKMKDEMKSFPIIEFIGLRAKMYSLLVDREKDSNIKRAKGVKKNVVKDTINHNNYREALFKNKQFLHLMNSFRSNRHIISTVQQNKVSLCSYDDKRYILKDGINTLPYGHYKIKELEKEEKTNSILRF